MLQYTEQMHYYLNISFDKAQLYLTINSTVVSSEATKASSHWLHNV